MHIKCMFGEFASQMSGKVVLPTVHFFKIEETISSFQFKVLPPLLVASLYLLPSVCFFTVQKSLGGQVNNTASFES